MKKNQNKLCYFFAFFPPKFLHFCRMTRIRYCRRFSFSYNCQHLLNQLILIQFFLIVRIPPLFYTNASECLQTSYDHCNCVVINKNGLQLLKNMLQIRFPYGI